MQNNKLDILYSIHKVNRIWLLSIYLDVLKTIFIKKAIDLNINSGI